MTKEELRFVETNSIGNVVRGRNIIKEKSIYKFIISTQARYRKAWNYWKVDGEEKVVLEILPI